MTDNPAPPAFRAALDYLAPLAPGRRAAMLQIFNGRVTWSAVKGWRNGRRRAPEWARALLARAVHERAQTAAGIAAVLAKENPRD